MSLEARLKEALHAQVATTAAPVGLTEETVRRGRRVRRLRGTGATVAVALVVGAAVSLVGGPRHDGDRLVTPATAQPSASPTATPEGPDQAGNAEVAAWLAGLPQGAAPRVVWTRGREFHSAGLSYTFPAGHFLVPLGRGGGGYVVELHSDGDTGAGDSDKSTGVITRHGYHEIDHGDLTHGLSPDGRLLASAKSERITQEVTAFDLFSAATGRRVAHIDYPYDEASVQSVSPREVRFRISFYALSGAERLVVWDIPRHRVRDLGPAPQEPSQGPTQVGDRAFTFERGILRETTGQGRSLALGGSSYLRIGDVVHESGDAVIAIVAAEHSGQLGLIRCRFSSQSCERASDVSDDVDFELDPAGG